MASKQEHGNIPFATIIASSFSVSLAVIHLFVPNVKGDTIALALFFLAVLHWVIPYLQRSVKTIDILGNKIEFLETEISKQQSIINDLVIFSISSSLFEILSYIYYRKEYRYHPNEGLQILNFPPRTVFLCMEEQMHNRS